MRRTPGFEGRLMSTRTGAGDLRRGCLCRTWSAEGGLHSARFSMALPGGSDEPVFCVQQWATPRLRHAISEWARVTSVTTDGWAHRGRGLPSAYQGVALHLSRCGLEDNEGEPSRRFQGDAPHKPKGSP